MRRLIHRTFAVTWAAAAALMVLLAPAPTAAPAKAQIGNYQSGLYTVAPGPNNITTLLPPGDNCYMTAWATDRPGGAGMMVSNCTTWQSDMGAQGPAGTNGNTILSGSGAPSGGTGVNGDWYMDTATTRMYGPKTGSGWGSGISVIGPAGATGSTGATGSQGPAGFGTVTPGVPTRACNTNYQPSATNAVFVSYSVTNTVTNPLLAGSSTATVSLASDANTTPTTERARASATSAVGLTVSLQITQTQVTNLAYIVPAGHYIRLNCTTSGTASNGITVVSEAVLG